MKIKNKIESSQKIEELKLNKFPEEIFKSREESKVIEFINKYPAKYYAIRDKAKSRGVFKLAVTKEDILKEIKDYELFSINVSSTNYKDNQVLVGEIEILSNSEIYLTLSKRPDYSVRDAISYPDYNFKTDIFDKRLNEIEYFDYLYKYILKNNLLDTIVEFSLFNIKVGINNENIVIYEIRTDY